MEKPPKGTAPSKMREYYNWFWNEHGDEVVTYYLNCLSAHATKAHFDIGRKPLEQFLKDREVYEPKSLGTRDAARDKARSTLLEKYGVVNPGQRSAQRQRLQERNDRATVDIPYSERWEAYKREVTRSTKINKRHVVDTGYCFYTGLKFPDCDTSNPNDPLKRCLEHKMSVFEGFVRGIPPEVIGGVSNLVWSIRLINSVKGNMSTREVVQFAEYIRESFKNAGHESN